MGWEGVLLIGLDLDGVIVDLSTQLRDFLRALGYAPAWTVDPPAHELCFWGLPDWLVPEVERFFASNVPYVCARPYAGALRACSHLRRCGALHILTSRSPDLERVTRRWLDVWGVPYERLWHTSDKAGVACRLGLTHVFEDAPHYLEELQTTGAALYRPQRDYNRHAPGVAYSDWFAVLRRPEFSP